MAVWGRESGGCIYTEGSVGGWSDRDDARAELDANGDIVGAGEASLAETDGKGRLAGAAIANTDELRDVIPR